MNTRTMRWAGNCGVTILLVGSAALPARADRAEFRGLGILSGGAGSGATAVSADGSVVAGNVSGNFGVPSVAFRWTRATGMVPLGSAPGVGPCNYYGLGISGDGSTIVGYYAGISPNDSGGWLRWTVVDGAVPIATPFGQGTAYAASFDGSVIVGTGNPNGCGSSACVWTAQTGLVALDNFGGPYATGEPCGYGAALGVSADGSVAAGWSAPQSNGNSPQAFRSIGGQTVGLGYLPGGGTGTTPPWPTGSVGTAISADGQAIVGWSDFTNSGNDYQAFRWTQATGMQGLGDLPGGSISSRAFAVSADGSVVVGAGNFGAPTEAFIWTATTGMRRLQDVLSIDLGLNTTGWAIQFALGVSADGRTIVGAGVNPCGVQEGWIAYLGTERVCPADFNDNGALSVQDIFAFLNAWFAGDPRADFNGCGLSVQDIFDFLNAWFTGCP